MARRTPPRRRLPRQSEKHPKDKTLWFSLGYFGSSMNFAFVPSVKAWDTTMKEFEVSGEAYSTAPANCMTLSYKNKRSCFVTISEQAQDAVDGINVSSLILHEATHVFQALCEHIGEKHPSSEFMAYMIQNIYGDLCQAYCETREDLFKRSHRKSGRVLRSL